MGFKVASRVRGLSDEAFREAFGTEEQCRTALVRLQCLLVIIGATPEGKNAACCRSGAPRSTTSRRARARRRWELAGLIDGVRESAQSWRELLLDLKRRGGAPRRRSAAGSAGKRLRRR